jgi:hypothetical protein
MKQLIEAQVNEDSIVFSPSELVAHTPNSELEKELEEFIASHKARTEKEVDSRCVEIEERYTEFARLLLDLLKAGKMPPSHKSYSLNS